MRALVCTRAEFFPARTMFWSCSRSSLLSRISGAVFILEEYHYVLNFVGKVLRVTKKGNNDPC